MEHIEIILLQRVAKLGTIGDVVKVRPGFARNYLFPKKIALRANKENMKFFEEQRAQIEANNAKTKAEAEAIAKKMEGLTICLARQASEKGQLYGSVTGRDIASEIKDKGFHITAGQVNLGSPIKELGVYDVNVDLHPEISIVVKLSVAKSEEEALLQAKNQTKAEA